MRARTLLLSTALVVLSAPAGDGQTLTADHYLPSRPENVTWGWFPVNPRPVLTVQSGQTVRIDTISHQGSTQDENPVGIDRDLNRAMRKATLEVVDFLVKEKGLTPAKAFSLASIAVDFHIAEAVDDTQVVAGMIPKNLFRGP